MKSLCESLHSTLDWALVCRVSDMHLVNAPKSRHRRRHTPLNVVCNSEDSEMPWMSPIRGDSVRIPGPAVRQL